MPRPAPLWDLLGFGAVTVDDLICVDRYPPPDAKEPIISRQQVGGGLAGTALVAAARLGAQAAYCGVLGNDALSRFTLEELERAGVDCSAVIHRTGAQPIQAVVIVGRPSARRSILFSEAGFQQPDASVITEALLTRARVLFVDHTAVEAGLLAAPIARAHGIPIVADFERSTSPRLAELIPQVDHLILNRTMGQQLTGAADPSEMVRTLAGPSQVCCAVTAGEDGLWYAERGKPPCHLPAFAVAAVDTTGCGDVLHGAYASAIARGSGVHQALMLGAAAAALKTLAPGGRAGIPDLPTVLRFLADCGFPLAHGKPAILNRGLNP